MGHPFHLHTAVSDEIQKIAQTDPERAAEMRATSVEYANEVRGFYDDRNGYDEPEDCEYDPEIDSGGEKEIECHDCGTMYDFCDGIDDDNYSSCCPNCGAKPSL